MPPIRIQGSIIGVHDTGFWDREDRLRVGRPLGHKLNAQEAADLARRTPGAELIVRTSGLPALNHHHDELQRNPYENYDVYQVSVIDSGGRIIPEKTLSRADLLANVAFKKDLISLFEDPQTGLVPSGLTLSSQDHNLVDLKWKGGKIPSEHFYQLAFSVKALGSVPMGLQP